MEKFSLEQTLAFLADFLPNLIGALVILVMGWVLPTGFQFMDRGTYMVKGKHESFRVSKTGKMAVGRYLAYDEVQVHPRAAATQARVIVSAPAML